MTGLVLRDRGDEGVVRVRGKRKCRGESLGESLYESELPVLCLAFGVSTSTPVYLRLGGGKEGISRPLSGCSGLVHFPADSRTLRANLVVLLIWRL